MIAQAGNEGIATRLDGITRGGNDMMMLDGGVCIGFFSFLVRDGVFERAGGAKKMGDWEGEGDKALYDVIVRYPLADSFRVCGLNQYYHQHDSPALFSQLHPWLLNFHFDGMKRPNRRLGTM